MIAVPLTSGAVLDGKYRIERVLGQGGMGVVFSAVHLELDERVAIKLLLGAPSEASAKRFLTEARAAAKVKSEHVCRAFDFGRTPTGEPYIVMEYLDGHDLGDELTARGPLSAEEVVAWGRQACEGLAVAHALGIVHRDIKPANLFLANPAHGSAGARTLKVLDFGVSKAPGSSVTRSAAAMGSPLYMAPEQMASSRDVDARADVWSLGATLYEVASGSPPFDTDNLLELATMIRDVEVPDLSLARPDFPPSLCAVVARCLRKDPALRFRDAAALGDALGEVFGASSEAAPLAASRRLPFTYRDGAPAPAPDEALQRTQRAAGVSAAQTPRGAGVAPPTRTTPGAASVESSDARPAARWPLAVGLLSLAIAAAALVVRARHGDSAEARALPSSTLASAALPGSSPSVAPTPPTPTAAPSSPAAPATLAAAPSAAPAATLHAVSSPAKPGPTAKEPTAAGRPGPPIPIHGPTAPSSTPPPPPRL